MKPKTPLPKNCRTLMLTVTSRCNRNCAHCGVTPWRQAYADYTMPLADVKELIRQTKVSGYRFGTLIVTGGEPLCWPDLLPALRILRTSGIARQLWLRTNATNLAHYDRKYLRQVLRQAHMVLLSFYGDNQADMRLVSDLVPMRRIGARNNVDFYLVPREPVPDSIPGKCGCPGIEFCHGRITMCPHLKSIAAVQERTLEDYPKHSIPLRVKYLQPFLKHTRGTADFCRWCMANDRVSRHLQTYNALSGQISDRRPFAAKMTWKKGKAG